MSQVWLEEDFFCWLLMALKQKSPDCVINLDNIVTDPAPMIIDRNNRIIYPESGSRSLTIGESLQIFADCCFSASA